MATPVAPLPMCHGLLMMFTDGETHTVDDINPALPEGPSTMGIMLSSLFWVMQDLYHQP